MSRELHFDFPGLKVGIAEYEEGPTGCTVFHLPPGGAACSVDIRGGSPGIIGNYEWAHAVCFAGGSLYGLEAACGVAAELMAMRGYTVGWEDVELVLGAIVYDFGRRDNAIYPDAELGRQALRAAKVGVFPLGRRGAGRSVTVGKTFDLEQGEFSGQGGAFRQIGPTKIAVFTVVNAFGAIVDREGNVVRGHYDAERDVRTPLVEGLEAQLPQVAPGNTTLTLVITNQTLTRRELRQLGVQVHGSMGRAIQPFHALVDGDVLYTVSTNEVENPDVTSMSLGVLASELAWDAVLSSLDESSASSE
jgi:6-aminohexanoate-oligomer endohydrolase